jgi:hypothetical protein
LKLDSHRWEFEEKPDGRRVNLEHDPHEHGNIELSRLEVDLRMLIGVKCPEYHNRVECDEIQFSPTDIHLPLHGQRYRLNIPGQSQEFVNMII